MLSRTLPIKTVNRALVKYKFDQGLVAGCRFLASRFWNGGPIGRSRRFQRLKREFLCQNNWPSFKDRSGKPLPWFTYPATLFLEQLLTPTTKVFEWGGGNSTLFFKHHNCELKTVDHDKRWVYYLLTESPDLAITCLPRHAVVDRCPSFEALLTDFDAAGFDLPVTSDDKENLIHGLIMDGFEAYAKEICASPVGHFDVVVVDGMARSLCAYVASRVMSDRGFIVLDNSDRWQYNSVMEYLNTNGFGRIDFWGLGPCLTRQSCTSVFSRRFQLQLEAPQRPRNLGDIEAV